MYVALSNRDAVAAVSIGKAGAPELGGEVGISIRGCRDRVTLGAEPVALAMSEDRTRGFMRRIWGRTRWRCLIRSG